MKLLEGYVENRTKEAALAAMMLALFFVARTLKFQAIPGIYLLDFAGAVIYAAVVTFSWPYSILYPFATMYAGSNIMAVGSWLVGCQVAFWLTKVLRGKRIIIAVFCGQFLHFLAYGVILHYVGMMNYYAFLVTCTPPFMWSLSTTVIGAGIILTIFRKFDVID